MSRDEEHTKEKIILSALTLFSERGISKTSVSEIAYHAGVTRVTVYRYFSEKEELVREAYLRVEQVFQKALADLEQDPLANQESIFNQIGDDLSTLPSGDVFAQFNEIKRLYPDTYTSIQKVRIDTLNGIFEHLFAMTKDKELLRPGLNQKIVQTIFWELIINFFDNPRFKSFGLSNAELYHTLIDIFLHGILKD
jgi:AcrR family transcriptional regulator